MYGKLAAPAPLAILIMRPRPRTIMPGITAFEQSIGPRRFTSIFLHQSLELVSQAGPTGDAAPAALISRSIGPSFSSATDTMLRTAPASVTSVGIAMASVPAARKE